MSISWVFWQDGISKRLLGKSGMKESHVTVYIQPLLVAAPSYSQTTSALKNLSKCYMLLVL